MNTAAQAIQGYRSVQLHAEAGRGVEAKLFAEITAEMVRAARGGRAGFRDLVTALHRNRLLWDALMVDLADRRNGLPDALRAELIGLGHFVRTFSGRVLQGQEDVQPLIDVKNSILAGLRAHGTDQGDGNGRT
jgi:flagellar biosynthesis activator protein FlaF